MTASSLPYATIRCQTQVFRPVEVYDPRGRYQLHSIIHGAIGRELSKRNRYHCFKAAEGSRLPAPLLMGNVTVVSQSDTVLEPGDSVDFQVRVLGPGLECLKEIAEAIGQAVWTGIGGKVNAETHRGSLYAHHVSIETAAWSPQLDGNPEDQVFTTGANLIFQAPIALQLGSEITTKKFSLDLFSKSLLYRYGPIEPGRSSVWASYGQGAAPLPAQSYWSGLKLIWHECEKFDWALHRHDGSPQPKQEISGLSGRATLIGNISPALPLLRIASMLGVGTGTSLGLGQFQIQIL
jgi:hypothetical protein